MCYKPMMTNRKFCTRRYAFTILGLVATSCTQPAPTPASDNRQVDAPVAAPTTARVLPAPPALSRGDLVAAAAQAASAYAAGQPPAAVDPLAGRTFAIRMPFACNGRSAAAGVDAPAGLAQARIAADGKAVALTLTPGDWAGSAWLNDGERDRWEAVEGYWIPRPWLAAEGCPKIAMDPLSTTPAEVSPQTLGLAALHAADSSRIGRRNGRSYAFTVPAAEGATPMVAADGYRLRLEGRVGQFADGRAIRCRAGGPDQRPVCVIAVKLDRVAFENAEGTVLSDWRTG